MERTKLLKAIADESRFKILTLLLQHDYCVRALSRKLELSESAVSQHLKLMREAGLIVGEKKGYFMHYDVNRNMLHQLASQIEELALVKRENCRPESGGCKSSEQRRCHTQKGNHNHTEEGKHHCQDDDKKKGFERGHGNCHCHRP